MKRLLERAVAGLVEPERLRDRRQEQRGVGHRLERHEPHAVREQFDGLGCRVEREARLAGAARSGERHEAYVFGREQRLERLQLIGSPDERRRLCGKVRRAVLQRPQRWEVGVEARREELVQPLRLRQVLQAVLAEVARLGVGEISRRLGEHDLAAVRRRADAGGAVDVEADVAAADERRLSRMEAHPDADGQSVERALPGGCGLDGVVRAVEGVEQRVALRVHLMARGERIPQPAPMLLELPSVLLGAELGEQARRPLDVSEEERHGAARQRVHAANSRSWTTVQR